MGGFALPVSLVSVAQVMIMERCGRGRLSDLNKQKSRGLFACVQLRKHKKKNLNFALKSCCVKHCTFNICRS